MHERMRIHHSVGSRVLLDTDGKDAIPFIYERRSEGWVFKLFSQRTAAIDEVIRFKNEMNIFIFKEQDGIVAEKVWFYTEGEGVRYDEDEQCLTILAGSQIAYKPADYQEA